MCRLGCSLIVAAWIYYLWSRLLPHRFRPVRYVSLSVRAGCCEQIARGADYDVFLAANERFVDRLVANKAVAIDSKVVYATGRIGFALCIFTMEGLTLRSDACDR